VCGGKIKDAVVYLNAGSAADLAKSKIVDQHAFWHCGIHTSDTNMRGCVDVLVVEVKDFDQFNLSFCSVKCLQDFFASIIAELKKKAAQSKKHG
jgi:hypothetical protein